ncbi:unnamed protein product, partial [Polarella glacialis]
AELQKARAARSTKRGPDFAARIGGNPSKEQIIDLLSESTSYQVVAQREISALARSLVQDGVTLSFVEAHQKVAKLALPEDPLEEYGMPELAFQEILLQYEHDEEVMLRVRQALLSPGKGGTTCARGIPMGKIIEIHAYMVIQMQQVLNEYRKVADQLRNAISRKSVESAAELLVSMAVEKQFGICSEDIEQ